MLYGILIPLVLVQFFALLCIPSLLAAPMKARAVTDAIHCYALQGLGVLLMSLGALPTVYSVLAGISYPSGTYFGLLLVFAVGGALFLWQDLRTRHLDPVARAVPAAIFFSTVRLIGQSTFILALLSFMLSLTLDVTDIPGWWVMPVVVATFGGLLAWCTKSPTTSRASMHLRAVGLPKFSVGRPAKAQPPVRTAVAGGRKKSR